MVLMFWGRFGGINVSLKGYLDAYVGDIYVLTDRGNSVMMYQSNQGNIKSI